MPLSVGDSQRRGNLEGRVAVAYPTITLGRQPMYSAHPKYFQTYIQSTEQTKRYRPTVLYSTNRKLRSTSTCRIESTHPPVESADPMKKSFPRYWGFGPHQALNTRAWFVGPPRAQIENSVPGRLKFIKTASRLSMCLMGETDRRTDI